MAFPTLFPFSYGDVTDRDRISNVILVNSNKHLLKYCIHDSISDIFVYLYAKYDQWMHWSQNTAERYRVNRQRNIYLRKNPEDKNLTEEALRSILNENGKDLAKLLSRMQIFNANIIGSNAYFYKRRSKLEALMEQEGMPTIWFMLSATDNH